MCTTSLIKSKFGLSFFPFFGPICLNSKSKAYIELLVARMISKDVTLLFTRPEDAPIAKGLQNLSVRLHSKSSQN